MLPARAAWPPNSLTPRRLLSLSRPLRELPPAFLCAIVNYFALGGLDFVAVDFVAGLAAPLAGAAFFVDGLSALAGVAFLGLAGALSAVSGVAAASLAGA